MAELPRPRSPLAYLDLTARAAAAGEGAGVTLAQRPFLGMLSLRGDANDPRFAAAVQDAAGADLPATPGSSSNGGSVTLFWLAPDEWLVVCGSSSEAADLSQSLSAALEGQHAAVIDVSSGRAVIRLGGTSAKAVLQEGSSLDFDAPHFQAGRCASTRLGSVDVLLHQVEDDREGTGPLYDIYVPRSYAISLWHRLEGVSAEYGLAVSVV